MAPKPQPLTILQLTVMLKAAVLAAGGEVRFDETQWKRYDAGYALDIECDDKGPEGLRFLLRAVEMRQEPAPEPKSPTCDPED